MKEQIRNKVTIHFKRIWPFAIVLTGLLLSASITFASFSFLTNNKSLVEKPVEKEAVLGLEVNASAAPTLGPVLPVTPSPSIIKKVIPSAKPSVSPTPSPSPVLAPSPVANSQSNNSNSPSTSSQNSQSTPTPTPTVSPSPDVVPSPSASSTPSPSPSPAAQMISMEIKQPDATFNFNVEISEGMNVCQVMQKAKDEGKINSLTINDKYLATFNTLLIEEINGYKNSWVFTVNGESPMGCSLTSLKNEDKIAWEFLNL